LYKILVLLILLIATAHSEIDSTIFRIEWPNMKNNFISFKIAYESSEWCDALIYAKQISSFFLRYQEAEQYREWKGIVDQMRWCCERSSNTW